MFMCTCICKLLKAIVQVLTWLESNARQVVARVDKNDPLVADYSTKLVCDRTCDRTCDRICGHIFYCLLF